MSTDIEIGSVGFIGAGRMARALAHGLCSAGVVRPDEVLACDVSPEAAERFTADTGGRIVSSGPDVLAEARIVVLAVKPQHIGGVLDELKPHVRPAHLMISIAAGVSTERLCEAFGPDCRIVRVMPNTPVLVGAGAAGFALAGAATADDAQVVERLLGTVGIACALPETLLDAVTGLSGSGPAYVYQIIEGLADGGVRMGLPRDVAARLAAQTVYGAAKMVLETGEHPAVLKDAVASPGGTTIAGVHALERAGLRGALMNAVEEATRRSRELGRSS